MNFKDNLNKKIEIDELYTAVAKTIIPGDSGTRLDKNLTEKLLKAGPFKYKKERDLDLYLFREEDGQDKVLCLDNELAIYSVGPDEVGLLKSPLIKEMVSIRNAIKILNDSKVIESKKQESLKRVRNMCVAGLDLHYTDFDIDQISENSRIAWEIDDAKGAEQGVRHFVELLDYTIPPKSFRPKGMFAAGRLDSQGTGKAFFGPMVIFDKHSWTLELIEERMNILDRDNVEKVLKIGQGIEKGDISGSAVFVWLGKAAKREKKELGAFLHIS